MNTTQFQERFTSLKTDLGNSINELLRENSLYNRAHLKNPLIINDNGGEGYNTVISSVTKDLVHLTAGYEEESSYEDDGGGLTFEEMSIEQMLYVHGELEAGRFETSI